MKVRGPSQRPPQLAEFDEIANAERDILSEAHLAYNRVQLTEYMVRLQLFTAFAHRSKSCSLNAGPPLSTRNIAP